jgi:ABC-type Fe3+-hydroxamate transport system substrate-binding protein
MPAGRFLTDDFARPLALDPPAKRVVSLAPSVNLGGAARVEWPVIPAAVVRRLDPDVIVIAEYPGSPSVASLVARDGWDRLTGPGLIDGLQHLAALPAA